MRPEPLGANFHPGIRDWFDHRFPAPTPVQSRAWPLIAEGRHLLITAPTGSGKTLTAFLWSLNQYATGRFEPGRTRVLYVSPLKALNNDIRRNLLEPLAELEARALLPRLRAETRSGDTPPGERQRLLRRPPEILITTPESLNLMLTTERGRLSLANLECVILDEIHALVDNRRGVQLLTALERIVAIAGEFQRLALSATVHPLEAVARHVGGFDAADRPREVTVVADPGEKRIEFRVRFPEAARRAAEHGQKIWDPLADVFREEVAAHRSTLFFTNSRRLAEKITFKINEGADTPLAYAHHGSLSREIRTEVERRLKAGELRAIVATSSLEMGIDIGRLDEVVLVQCPPSIAAAVQRIGRAGHNVGETSRGVLFPTHAEDLLEAAVLADAIAERALEPLAVLCNPLDVLAQIIVSCCATTTWRTDELFALLRRAAPYRTLPRAQFDLVLDMLCGRYAGTRIRELKARLRHDRIDDTIVAQRGAVLALYNAGGTIPDRGYFKIRHADSGTLIGELDEEFVWEATIGQSFTLGTQNWQIQRITHNDVLVRAAVPSAKAPPFWRSEGFDRSYFFSERIARFLEHAEDRLAAGPRGELTKELEASHGFDSGAAAELADYLARQREATRAPLPHRHHLLIEVVHRGPGGYRGPNEPFQTVVHTFWGGRVNRPWALALEAALADAGERAPELHVDDDAIVIQTREPLDPAWLQSAVRPDNLEALLRRSLEDSGFFGARFRECAGRALLLSRARFNQRLPLWMSRLKAKQLMDAVREYADFPVLLETWRTCLKDAFDLEALVTLLDDVRDGRIGWTTVHTALPSPFAAKLTYAQVGRYMYADDTPEQRGQSGLSTELIRELIDDPARRPRLTPGTVADFVEKRQRLAPGYEPVELADWHDWVKDRVLIPAGDYRGPLEGLLVVSRGPESWVMHPELGHALIACGLLPETAIRKDVALVRIDDRRTAVEFARELLSYHGPFRDADLARLLPSSPPGLLEEAFVSGALIEGDEHVYHCDARNFEYLLRMQRARARPDVNARGADALPADLALWQRFNRGSTDAAIEDALLLLRGYCAPVRVWLEDLLAARCADPDAHRLEGVSAALGLDWFGCGREAITVGFAEDAGLLLPPRAQSAFAELFADREASYGYLQLADRFDGSAEAFEERFWEAVWQGEIAGSSLAPLRQGLAREFRLERDAPASRDHRSLRRRARVRSVGLAGSWSLRRTDPAATDALSELDRDKERARLLLDRYGIVCREIVNREGGVLRWARIFRALYTMELGGEVVAGYFYEGLSGPQFMTPAAAALFQRDETESGAFWINAVDPVSPCGLGLADARLPARRPQNYLAYHGRTLALCAENHGRRLTFHIADDDARLPEVLALLVHLARRQRRVAVETINDLPARTSPYLIPIGAALAIVKDHKLVTLEIR